MDLKLIILIFLKLAFNFFKFIKINDEDKTVLKKNLKIMSKTKLFGTIEYYFFLFVPLII